MPKTPTVGIIGGTIWGNRGAESMLVTTIGKIREKHPDTKFKVFTYYPKKDRLLVEGNDNIEILSSKPETLVLRFFPFALLHWFSSLIGIKLPDAMLTRVVRELRQCDVLLDIGGVTFMDGRELFLPYNILTIFPAMLLGVPVVKLSQAMGPFHNPLNRWLSKVFLKPCDHLFARGKITADHLGALGLKNYITAADLAFLYKPEFNLSRENEAKVEVLVQRLEGLKKSGKRIISIAPSSLVLEKSQKNKNDYIGFILGLLQKLNNEKTHFLFLPNSTVLGSNNLFNNDIYAIKELAREAEAMLPEEICQKIEWVTWDINTYSLRRLMVSSNLLLTSRFHAMISGLSLCIPTLVIGWSHKYIEALAGLEMEKYAADFASMDSKLEDLAKELLENEDVVKKQLANGLQKAQASSLQQFSYLEKFLN